MAPLSAGESDRFRTQNGCIVISAAQESRHSGKEDPASGGSLQIVAGLLMTPGSSPSTTKEQLSDGQSRDRLGSSGRMRPTEHQRQSLGRVPEGYVTVRYSYEDGHARTVGMEERERLRRPIQSSYSKRTISGFCSRADRCPGGGSADCQLSLERSISRASCFLDRLFCLVLCLSPLARRERGHL
jgi:hypothetical protein